MANDRCRRTAGTLPHGRRNGAAATERARLVLAIRRSGVTDPPILSTIEAVPRENFVPEAFAPRAYEDAPLPIECGQTVSQPSVVAWMTAALELDDRMKVLEVGTGAGYQTAILSRLCRRVYTVERHRKLARGAQARFEALGLCNITGRVGDGSRGWPEQAPFPRILVTAAAAEPPPLLVDQLAVDGVMVMPLGPPDGDQDLVRLRRTLDGLSQHRLFGVRFLPLIEGDLAP